MAQKCVSCQAPISGFFSRISALAGVKQSTVNPDYCNKCEGKAVKVSKPEASSSEPLVVQPLVAQAEVKPLVTEPEDILAKTNLPPKV